MKAEPLSPGEIETLRAAVDRLIPADESGPGALGAGVDEYIISSLQTRYIAYLPRYRAGLGRLEEGAQNTHHRSFAASSAKERDALLAAAEVGDREFFDLLHAHTMEGMFGDPVHGGNRERVGWRLIGYPGPRKVWSADDQRLGGLGA